MSKLLDVSQDNAKAERNERMVARDQRAYTKADRRKAREHILQSWLTDLYLDEDDIEFYL